MKGERENDGNSRTGKEERLGEEEERRRKKRMNVNEEIECDSEGQRKGG